MSKSLSSRPAPAPSEAAPFIPIVRCNAAEKFQVRFVCLATNVFGVKLHYASRSKVCLAPDEPCEHCDNGRKWEWKGYLPATDHQCQKLFLVELTNGVMPSVNRYLELWGTLRGRYITLTRPSGHANGRLAIDFATEASTVPGKNLPESFDVGTFLKRVFGIERSKPAASDAKPPTHADWVNDMLGDRSTPAVEDPQQFAADVRNVRGQFTTPSSNGKH